MTDDHIDHPEAEFIDTGEPISALRNLEEPVSETFMNSLNRRIQRRLLATDVGKLAWRGPILMVLELLSLIFSIGIRNPDEQKE